LSRADFEQRLRQAARAADRVAPRLVEAHYNAALKDSNGAAALVGGGQWKVAHAGAGAGLLPLKPFNLALRQARLENRDPRDARGPARRVDAPGDHAGPREWSARGEAGRGGAQFALRLPPAPVAVLEVAVPEGRAVAALDGALVSGPHPAEAADRRLWKVYCG